MLMRTLSALLLVTSTCGCALAQKGEPWSQLSLSACKVDEFIAQHPTSDGRGVVVAVLDTGVDPGVPGLLKTRTGQVKVIDVQDFSGQGDVALSRAFAGSESDKIFHRNKDGARIEYTLPAGMDATSADPALWFGILDERRFTNSDVSDINDNGETDDEFAVLVVAPQGTNDDGARAYVDTDMDRDFSNERELASYHLRQDTFVFARRKPEEQIIPLTMAVNLFMKERKAVFHFDDGGHGTHVAGIAAGYQIQGQPDFHGVAPGAQVISLKISQNSIGGVTTSGSKMAAFEYAARYAREHNVPVVCNLSFGIGSAVEGEHDIDQKIEDLCRKNPNLIICHSAGNEGPGLSTIGTPAPPSAITVAALMAADTARDQMGSALEEAQVAVFSSRGGELAKPDVAVPGYATSTVPRWNDRRDFWRGTSMSSPYAAGLCALLVGDALQQEPGARVRQFDVKRALCASARMLPDTTPLDVGWGLPDVAKAREILGVIRASARDDPIMGYEISTRSPSGPDGEAAAAYWRSVYFPTEEGQTFTIRPVFEPGTTGPRRTDFSRRFELRSNAPWCRVNQEKIYLRGEQTADVRVVYDAQHLSKPGLYVGTVDAMHEGRVAFRLVNTVIVPERFLAENGYRLHLAAQIAKGWSPNRHFFFVPPGASAMTMTLSAPEGKRSLIAPYRLFNPAGEQLTRRTFALNTDEGIRRAEWNVAEELGPGVWELDVTSNRLEDASDYELTVQFYGLHAEPGTITEWEHKGGTPPSGELTVTNLFDRYIPATVEGRLEGYREQFDKKFKGYKDTVAQKFALDGSTRAARIRVELAKEDYGKTTDIAIMVTDASGNAVLSAGMGQPVEENTLANPSPKADSVELTLKVIAAFAVADADFDSPVTIRIDHLYAEPIPIEVTHGKANQVRLVPGVPADLDFALSGALPAVPDGMRPIGYIDVKARGSEDTMLRVPIDVGG